MVMGRPSGVRSCSETADGDATAKSGQSNTSGADEDRASADRALREEVREFSEHVRRVQLETEARILARWKKRGLFGLTTSTG